MSASGSHSYSLRQRRAPSPGGAGPSTKAPSTPKTNTRQAHTPSKLKRKRPTSAKRKPNAKQPHRAPPAPAPPSPPPAHPVTNESEDDAGRIDNPNDAELASFTPTHVFPTISFKPPSEGVASPDIYNTTIPDVEMQSGLPSITLHTPSCTLPSHILPQIPVTPPPHMPISSSSLQRPSTPLVVALSPPCPSSIDATPTPLPTPPCEPFPTPSIPPPSVALPPPLPPHKDTIMVDSSPSSVIPPSSQIKVNPIPTPVPQGHNWEIGHMTSKGGRQENQDAYLVYSDHMPFIFALCDGHGPKGREAAVDACKHFVSFLKQQLGVVLHGSNHVPYSAPPSPGTPPTPIMTPSSPPSSAPPSRSSSASRLSESLSSQLPTPTQLYMGISQLSTPPPVESAFDAPFTGDMQRGVSQAINDAFMLAHDKIIAKCLRSQQDYGTTACLSVVYGDSLTLGWAGDSRVLLFTRAPSTPGSSNTRTPLQVSQLSQDHVPMRQDERQRIEAAGGRIIERKIAIPPKPGAPSTEGPTILTMFRVQPSEQHFAESMRGAKLSLNISRALGHVVLSRFGVTPQPDTSTATLRDGDLVLLCSDGLWNEISNEEMASIIDNHPGEDLHRVCAVLVREAEARCKIRNVPSDNVTVVMYRHASPRR
eukprot:TRINITY_DN4567_c0_g1_i2.p1 TRINITY_DN4567_c0_g1~~TRINITY_DN4567_c0_g1_i2.p1  ORF type:complete len:649 (-),score=119.16 TRINITY_DN4567_c0_g1_i2:1103-3049(-)